MVGMRRWTLAAGTAAFAMAVAAGSVLAADTPVTIAGFAFDPTTVTIDVGDSVTWTNNDGVAHTATAIDGSFDSGNIGGGGTATVTFDTAGTFAYHCRIHPTMNGTVVVQAAAAATPAPTIGEGVSITPAPTDTLAATAAREDRDALALTLGLAGLGIVMLAGGLVADRRFRRRDR